MNVNKQEIKQTTSAAVLYTVNAVLKCTDAAQSVKDTLTIILTVRLGVVLPRYVWKLLTQLLSVTSMSC